MPDNEYSLERAGWWQACKPAAPSPMRQQQARLAGQKCSSGVVFCLRGKGGEGGRARRGRAVKAAGAEKRVVRGGKKSVGDQRRKQAAANVPLSWDNAAEEGQGRGSRKAANVFTRHPSVGERKRGSLQAASASVGGGGGHQPGPQRAACATGHVSLAFRAGRPCGRAAAAAARRQSPGAPPPGWRSRLG